MDINKISLIIPTRNCGYLEKVLPKLDQFFEEIIVVGESNLNFSNFNILQRGRAKKNILFYLLNQVGCIKTLSIRRIIKQIEEDLN